MSNRALRRDVMRGRRPWRCLRCRSANELSVFVDSRGRRFFGCASCIASFHAAQDDGQSVAPAGKPKEGGR